MTEKYSDYDLLLAAINIATSIWSRGLHHHIRGEDKQLAEDVAQLKARPSWTNEVWRCLGRIREIAGPELQGGGRPLDDPGSADHRELTRLAERMLRLEALLLDPEELAKAPAETLEQLRQVPGGAPLQLGRLAQLEQAVEQKALLGDALTRIALALERAAPLPEPTHDIHPDAEPSAEAITSLRRMGLNALADEEQRRLAWIPVEERLPRPDEDVLVWWSPWPPRIARLKANTGRDGQRSMFCDNQEPPRALPVTHWQPLPPPPGPDTPTPPQNRPSEPPQPAGPTSHPSDEPAPPDGAERPKWVGQSERLPEEPPPSGSMCETTTAWISEYDGACLSAEPCPHPATGWYLPDDEAEPAVPACEEHATEIAAPGSAAWMRERGQPHWPLPDYLCQNIRRALESTGLKTGHLTGRPRSFDAPRWYDVQIEIRERTEAELERKPGAPLQAVSLQPRPPALALLQSGADIVAQIEGAGSWFDSATGPSGWACTCGERHWVSIRIRPKPESGWHKETSGGSDV